MKKVKYQVCPRCGNYIYHDYDIALSRKDNRTEICNGCGVNEAMEAWAGVEYTGKKYWEE